MAAMKGQPEGAEPPAWLTTLAMGIQWILVLVPFYPLLVGVPASRWKSDLGLNAPRGVFREIAFGIFAYLAGLPLLLLGAGISLILKIISDSINKTTGAPPSNPVIDEVMKANPLTLILFFCLATIWAPFVEEVVFRGALFRHLRSWLILPIAAIGSALVFGLMHGYELIMLGPVITLGFTFAMMRHYRGSLVGPITAHALHNGTVMLLLIGFITLANS
jgi:membrane protease YdiL (CAAX protease family)